MKASSIVFLYRHLRCYSNNQEIYWKKLIINLTDLKNRSASEAGNRFEFENDKNIIITNNKPSRMKYN